MSYDTHTQIFHVDPANIDPEIMQNAGACIRAGGLVAFPTETVYGLGANATNQEAVNRIFAAKQRPFSDPIIVHIAALEQLPQVARVIPALAYELAARFWAGALTLVLQRHDDIPANVSAGLDTVAVRMPNHPIALGLIRAAGVPIAAPSANTFTRPSPTTAAHVLEDLNGRIDIILDGGTTHIGLESTVLDLTSKIPTVLRPGGVIVEDLRDVIPDLQVQARFRDTNGADASASPGQLMRHYSPRAEVILFTASTPQKAREGMKAHALELLSQGNRVGMLLLETDQAYFSDLALEVVSLGENTTQAGINLFAGLRELDQRGVDVILVRAGDRAGLGLAVWDRLLRAAEGHVIHIDD